MSSADKTTSTSDNDNEKQFENKEETMEIVAEMVKELNLSLNHEALEAILELLEYDIQPDTIAAVIKELSLI